MPTQKKNPAGFLYSQTPYPFEKIPQIPILSPLHVYIRALTISQREEGEKGSEI